jgi:hypothetical protein
LLVAVVTVAKGDLAIIDPLQATVANSHAKDVAGQISERLLRAAALYRTTHFLPNLTRQLFQ